MKKTQHIFCAMKPMTALAFCFNHECICKFMYLFDSFGCDRIRLSVADNCHRAYVEKKLRITEERTAIFSLTHRTHEVLQVGALELLVSPKSFSQMAAFRST